MKKDAFTLVELLAVIVILAVILVIAVPQIVNVINSTKTSSLETSVKMIAKRAEAYIEEQTMLGNTVPDTFNCSLVAKVSESDYSNCTIKRIGTKALVSLDGIGKFEGKYVYNGTKDVVEIQNSELTTLATTVITNSGNVSIDETGDKNIRYSGENPNNYVYFNCSDYSNPTSETCDKWRIIGIFNIDNGSGVIEQRVKIIGESIGNYSWDTSPSTANSGYGYNIWETKDLSTPKSTKDSTTKADVNRLLNEWYLDEVDPGDPVTCFNGQNGDATSDPQVAVTPCPSKLRDSEETQGYISDAVWNLGGTTFKNANGYAYNLPTLDTYNKERGSLAGSSAAKTISVEKIGLPYPSDFGYASTNAKCRNNLNAKGSTREFECRKALGNWMNNSSQSYWAITPCSSSDVFLLNSNGGVGGPSAASSHEIRPVVYLNSSVKITNGSVESVGSSSVPYKLGL